MTSKKDTDFKVQLVQAYDAAAQIWESKDNKRGTWPWKLAARQHFADTAEAEGKRTILELGAASGADSAYFKSREFDILATDLSSKMVEVCKRKGLDATILDLYELASLERQFDAIYSMNVLLHVPKQDLAEVLRGIHDSLSSNGIFFYGVYGGEEKEEVYSDDELKKLPRFFSFLSDETIATIVSPMFEIISSEVIDIGQSLKGLHFQSLLLRKK